MSTPTTERIATIREYIGKAEGQPVRIPAEWARDLLAYIDAQEKRVVDAEKDKARIDWLSEHKEYHVTFSQGGNPSWGVLHHSIPEAGCWYGGPLRSAIDHMMSEVAAGYPTTHPSGRSKLVKERAALSASGAAGEKPL